MSAPTPLEEKLRRLIAAQGPMPVAHYMAHCLGDPEHGYYRTRDPLGRGGDFVTAPEVSQMFGELLGLWAVAVWRQMGAPSQVTLAELGPGRGTLMADALRASRVERAFNEAVAVHLVETSPVLCELQQKILATAGVLVRWHEAIAALPEAPLILIANEFFDALPVYQAVRMQDGWHERMVGLDDAGGLRLALHPVPIPGFAHARPFLSDAPPGAVFEWRAEAEIEQICGRVTQHGGAALIVDYGHAESGFGDTFQAVRHHRFVDPLATPGEADLTAHVDFAATGRTGKRCGAAVHGPTGQGAFLRRLGIEARAARLKASATPAQRTDIEAELARLTGEGDGEMGVLFKAIALAHPALGPLPGFDS